MDSNQAKVIRDAFATDEGRKALDVLREISGYDRRVILADTEREQCFNTGRVSLFSEILDAINENKRNKKYGRKQPDSEF